MRRIATLIAAGTLALLAACGDDDDATPTTPPVTTAAESTTRPPTTEPPTTTTPSAPTTVAPTTAPPTTVDPDATLKAQIAADYVAANQRLEDLASAPSIEALEDQIANISAPGSVDESNIRRFITGLVEKGNHVVNGTPDYSTVTVESVAFNGQPPYSEATVTYCFVNNRIQIDANGVPQGGSGGLYATRESQIVVRTPNGWLPSSDITQLSAGPEGQAECPAA